MKEETTMKEAMEMAFDLLEEVEYVKYTKVWTRKRMIASVLENNTKDTQKLKRYINILDKIELGRAITWKTYLLYIIEYKWCPMCKTCQDIDNFMSNGKYCNNCKDKLNKRNKENYHKRGNKGKIKVKGFKHTLEDTKHYSNNELLLILKQFTEFLGEDPVLSMMINKNGVPSAETYRKRFKTWKKALELSRKDIVLENEEDKRYNIIHIKTTKKEITRQAIRKNSRRLLEKQPIEKECKICGYNTHVECCHIKDIQDYPDEALISVINAKENLVWLCPNHHYEFDAGIIDLDGNKINT